MSQPPMDSQEFSNINPELESGKSPRSQPNKEPSAENVNAGFKELDAFMAEPLPHAYTHVHDNRPTAAPEVSERWSKAWWKRMGGYTALAVISFVVFVYFSFPFAVLKESVVASVSEQLRAAGLEMRLNIGRMRPDWFTGIALQNVTVTNLRDAEAQLKFEEVTARLRLLPLLVGRVGVSLNVQQGKGSFSAAVSLPISGLLSGSPKLSEGDFVFRNFAIDAFVAQGMGILKGSTNPTMGLILPLISVTTAGGNLSGSINIDGSELSSFERFKGKIDLEVKGMFLHIADNVWQIPKQEFSAARIGAAIDSGAIVIAPTTQFIAPDVDVALGGRLTSAQVGMDAALTLKLSMRRRIQQNIGNLVPAVLKCLQPLRENVLQDGSKEMVLDAKLTGPLAGMTCDQS